MSRMNVSDLFEIFGFSEVLDQLFRASSVCCTSVDDGIGL